MADLPWKPDTPQERGRKSEVRQLRKRGARAHPGSGSGRIAFDGSTKEDLFEMKDVEKSFTLNAAYVKRFFLTALRQDKEPVMVVHLRSIGITAEIRFRREVA